MFTRFQGDEVCSQPHLPSWLAEGMAKELEQGWVIPPFAGDRQDVTMCARFISCRNTGVLEVGVYLTSPKTEAPGGMSLERSWALS